VTTILQAARDSMTHMKKESFDSERAKLARFILAIGFRG
jgi:hypothetical protein